MSEMQEEYEAQHKAESPSLLLSNKVYNWLKFVAQILLPGVGALYFALAQIWGLPAAEEVVGTITAVDVFLGLFLGSQSRAYNNSDEKYDGVIHVSENEDGTKAAALVLKNYENPADVVEQDEVLFKVKSATPVAK